ncbi:MAG: DUF302 domain-containing protein [SAR324 cluster bacterium]|nr:DUF302 domain-containing protein [SAR324 cluster bacterium]MBL7035594.1 DUF302 domain-containing protein [SAR324 cluster bacterium]
MEVAQDIVRKEFAGISFKVILEDLIQEIMVRNYLITRVSNIDNIHKRHSQGVAPDVDFQHYKIVEFCNLESCSELISSNLLAGVFMPVRFAAFQRFEREEIIIAFLKPTAFAGLFNSKKMFRIAEKLEQDMYDVLEELDF